MPELPEVETVKRILAPQLCGRRVVKLTVVRPEVLAYPELAAFCRGVESAAVTGMGRRGKFLLVYLEGGAHMVIHLRMTGQLLVTPAADPLLPHTHVRFRLDDGSELRFADTRRFGRLWLIGKGEEDTVSGIQRLGVEPLGGGLTAAVLSNGLGKRRLSVKQGLLDQSVVAGIGNIYADEVLFAAGISPFRPAAELTGADWQRLAEKIPAVLEWAVASNVMTPEEYLAGEGKNYRSAYFRVYGREGEPCPRCGQSIRRARLAGRSSFYCPSCQGETGS